MYLNSVAPNFDIIILERGKLTWKRILAFKLSLLPTSKADPILRLKLHENITP